MEGGLLPWRVQKVKMNGPTVDYSNLQRPLPDPPVGMKWKKDEETGEWNVVKDSDEKITPQTGESSNGPGALVQIEEGWELLSTASNENPVLVHRPGSVSSSSRPPSNLNSNSTAELASFSTLGSGEDGAAKLATRGIDYVEHIILPTDTFQGICLAYNISPIKIRQVNHFSGSSLLLAPKKLIIPLSGKQLQTGKIRLQDRNSKEFKIHTIIHKFPDLSTREATAYLELSEGNVDEAICAAREDREWELRQLESTNKSIQDHRVHVAVHEGIPVPTVKESTIRKYPSQELELPKRDHIS